MLELSIQPEHPELQGIDSSLCMTLSNIYELKIGRQSPQSVEKITVKQVSKLALDLERLTQLC